jgi:predicted PurR-regulated permease PerM
MVALLIGASLFGLAGAILAIPTAAILSVLVEQFAGPPR